MSNDANAVASALGVVGTADYTSVLHGAEAITAGFDADAAGQLASNFDANISCIAAMAALGYAAITNVNTS